ncbi:putative amidophosphoribosyltransferase [Rubidibacter lacunae KORDI 51-2]|uniref:Putative amidophosphoribosyltransferase n=1 Tax=Rubidibacter lacunae KORDI 51-2 TaxID=582515 RepID=U5DI06_9CHRO|nr:ComF family protein [Rubidibacter lacunae]ERN41301.1 putative amidophosphoribosyltransferase [Rubidibacter lacunae KORDI 51-2]
MLRTLSRGIQALLWQPQCPLCNRATEAVVCAACARQLKSCQLANCAARWCSREPVFAWGGYGGPLKRAIAALKYDSRPELGTLLGDWLGEVWRTSAIARDLKAATVVPIPLHPDKQRQRGYNQAELIARSFARITGLSLKPRVLVRVRATEALYGLDATGRQQAMTEAFALGSGRPLPRAPILLLDDIYTTGATTRAAKKVLIRAGGRVAGVAVAALAGQAGQISPRSRDRDRS